MTENPSDEMNPALPSEPFSPKLRQAMQEMLAITRKYDIGAYIVLSSEKHSEDRVRFPTWSVVTVESHGGKTGMRIKSKGRSRDDVAHTLNMLDSMATRPSCIALNIFDVLETLRRHWDFKTESRLGSEAPPWDSK